MSQEAKYRCPILVEMNEGVSNPMSVDEIHAETLPDMIKHLRDDNHWTDKEVADWQETAVPIDADANG